MEPRSLDHEDVLLRTAVRTGNVKELQDRLTANNVHAILAEDIDHLERCDLLGEQDILIGRDSSDRSPEMRRLVRKVPEGSYHQIKELLIKFQHSFALNENNPKNQAYINIHRGFSRRTCSAPDPLETIMTQVSPRSQILPTKAQLAQRFAIREEEIHSVNFGTIQHNIEIKFSPSCGVEALMCIEQDLRRAALRGFDFVRGFDPNMFTPAPLLKIFSCEVGAFLRWVTQCCVDKEMNLKVT
jgi:hypothetical protein